MATDNVVNNGTIAVAGAGNLRPSDDQLGTFCPAKSTDTIAVGMSETLCTASFEKEHSRHLNLEMKARPPGAYWIELEDASPYSPDQNYCGYQGCSAFQDCNNHRKTGYWQGNVNWEDYVPEVVAPGHRVVGDSESGLIALEPGTSYSSAVVSGGIASVLSDVLPKSPSPNLVRRAVEATSTRLGEGVVGKFNMSELKQALQ